MPYPRYHSHCRQSRPLSTIGPFETGESRLHDNGQRPSAPKGQGKKPLSTAAQGPVTQFPPHRLAPPGGSLKQAMELPSPLHRI